MHRRAHGGPHHRRGGYFRRGRYHRAHRGGRGWLGVRLDRGVNWGEVGGIIEDAYRAVAPKKLIAELDGRD